MTRAVGVAARLARIPRPLWALTGQAATVSLALALTTTTLPTQVADLDVSPVVQPWLATSTLIVGALILPPTSWLLARYGPRTLLLAATAMLLLGSTIVAFAPSVAVLITGKLVFEVGFTASAPLVSTTVRLLVSADRRGRTYGTIGVVTGVAFIVGPGIGGVLNDQLGWRWCSLVAIPLAATVLIVGWRTFHVDAPTTAAGLDALSLALAGVGIGGLVYGFTTIGSDEIPALLPAPIVLTVAVAALSAFIWRQRATQRRDAALFDLSIFAVPQYRLAAIILTVQVSLNIAVSATLLQFYIQNVLQQSESFAGIALIPGAVVAALLARPAGDLYDRFGPRWLVVTGTSLITLAIALYATLDADSPPVLVVAFDVIFATGTTLSSTPLIINALNAISTRQTSYGATALPALQQVGQAVATSILLAVATSGSGDLEGLNADDYRPAFAAAAACSLVLVALAFFVRRTEQHEPAETHFEAPQ
ncbi:MFS transporter [Mycobacterium sp. 236(2023)]|uniref:MFS transporter n=1 Tax=Mycobacterium sp. 236(2023) TaxID=3038163 RepID=UPI0024156A96|nr:MFS transporter [Mycobacterium sp. 236(2023)]MDG4669349.1 MFS transporter [Mycobacterium sp. 236(2023)]